jgi:hypothetical protein
MEGRSIMRPAALLLLFATSSNQYTPTLPGGIIAWAICNGRKKQEIGGWLLYYYWQLYSSVVLSAIFFAIAIQSYVPENFDDNKQYLLFLASTVPLLVVYALQVAVATFLISVRTWDLLCLLRWLIVAEVAVACVATAIDTKFFPDNVFLNVFTLVPAICWVAYFFKSQRIMHVFKSHDWDKAVTIIYPSQTPAT